MYRMSGRRYACTSDTVDTAPLPLSWRSIHSRFYMESNSRPYNDNLLFVTSSKFFGGKR